MNLTLFWEPVVACHKPLLDEFEEHFQATICFHQNSGIEQSQKNWQIFPLKNFSHAWNQTQGSWVQKQVCFVTIVLCCPQYFSYFRKLDCCLIHQKEGFRLLCLPLSWLKRTQQTCKKGQWDDCEGPHVAEASSRQLMILHREPSAFIAEQMRGLWNES